MSVPLSVAVLEKPRLRKPRPSLTLSVAVTFPTSNLALVGALGGVKVLVVAGEPSNVTGTVTAEAVSPSRDSM